MIDIGPHWIQTVSGLAFDLESPAGNVSGFDLSHALAGVNRFGGHLTVSYTVAQHSVLCAALIWQRTRDRTATLHALLHDAHEAYMGDLKSPVKAMINAWAPGKLAFAERQIDAAIWAWAGLAEPDPEVARLIKTADLALLFWERDRWAMKRPPRPWIGEGTVKQLRAADFGADDEPGFLECWERHVAMTAFFWTCRTLTGHIGSQPADVDVMRTGWSTVFRGLAREVSP